MGEEAFIINVVKKVKSCMKTKRDLIDRWIDKAGKDLRSAVHELSFPDAVTETICFHSQFSFTPNQYQALQEPRRRLFEEFDIEALILYGSAARGEADEESDLDLLIVTAQPLTRPARHEITDMVFEVNLLYDTNFSTLVVDRNSWEMGLFSVLPLREEILRDGVEL